MSVCGSYLDDTECTYIIISISLNLYVSESVKHWLPDPWTPQSLLKK